MVTTNEKTAPAATTTSADLHSPTHHPLEAGHPLAAKPWMYRSRHIGPIYIPAYASPPFQLGMVAVVCFLCPGMFNALAGLGGGGQFDATTANNANVAVYSTFSVVGFFAGTFANRMGIKLTLSLGGIGYFIYIASFLSYNRNQNSGFPIFAGALLGVCAGLLWCAQGAIMMSYPPEASKGRYISWFWMIFNLGAVLGSLIPLGQNIHSSSGNVNDGTYIGFMVLTFCGAALAWFLVDARQVQRADGSHVVLMKHPTWQSELLGLLETLKTDSWVVFLFPMFFASNWFYTYQFNVVNLARFNVRTRALNGVLYWLSQIIGAYIFGYALDISRVRRSLRAKAAWAVLFIITMAIWGGGYAWQMQYTRAETSAEDYVKMDWTSSGYVGPMFLYMFYGFYDAAWQTCVYWFMGALTNNGRKLTNFAGFYKGIQSAGTAIIFRIDALKAPFMNEFASCWGLLAGSLLVALPLILMKVRDTVPLKDDIKFSDETMEEVMPTVTHDHEEAKVH
ncbi:MAG: hypothetical protein Q9171_001329 [Xanthocarpia ochracea]